MTRTTDRVQDAATREIGASPPSLAKINEKTLTSIHAQLNEADFAKAWEQGRALTADEAVALASTHSTEPRRWPVTVRGHGQRDDRAAERHRLVPGCPVALMCPWTGLRGSEAAALRWKDIDRERIES